MASHPRAQEAFRRCGSIFSFDLVRERTIRQFSLVAVVTLNRYSRIVFELIAETSDKY